jgi:hypothetical protein
MLLAADSLHHDSFAVNFSVPYLVFPQHVGLNSKVGFIFGGVAMLSIIFTYFCVPECKGKTLEQIDWLFANGTKLRDFEKADAVNMLEEQIGVATGSIGGQDKAYAISKHPRSSVQIAS